VTDAQFMERALALAEHGRYGTSPNPMVGCVIVREGQVVAEGYHRRAGQPHAEIEALRSCADAAGATMFVTLEPCAHHGRTPPCSESIIAAGISRVVVAMRDPNELVDGRGMDMLRAAGITVDTGVLEAEARRLNERFVWSITQKLPFVVLKAGMTLDGKLATVTRESRWITGEAARQRSLALREELDAVMIGGGTLAADDPYLTRRLGLSTSAVPWTRVIVAGPEVSPNARVFHDGERTILFSADPPKELPRTVEVVVLPAVNGRIDLGSTLTELHARGIHSVLVEGGSRLHTDFIQRRLWQKMIAFVAPAFVGGGTAPSIFSGEPVQRLTDAYRFRFDRVEMVGGDLMVTAYPA
jgi:diaminohydroxyphosphoribosylaminopyrimidine deaminase/5-amino-6-(5-phosphoribosylamino)uracil reductase